MSYLSIIAAVRATLIERERATEFGHCTDGDWSFFLEDHQCSVEISHDGYVSIKTFNEEPDDAF